MWQLALAVLAIAVLGAIGRSRNIERRVGKRRRLAAGGVIPGAEAIRLERKDAPGVLLLHGAGDTPQQLSALARNLHDPRHAAPPPTPTRHGRALSAFATVTSA